MQHHEIIVVGGGPAGSTCAAELVARERDVLVLDRAQFPRLKLCAGWITESVMRDLRFTAAEYPHPLIDLNVRSHFPKVPIGLPWFPTPGRNFSIRRVEFDAWLLQRSGARVATHTVKDIQRKGSRYVLDGQFSCRYLVGAGGTLCPVRRALFPEKPPKHKQIVTLEHEFHYPPREDISHLYFGFRGLRGYAWYVPKGNGYVNIGIGGKRTYFARSHWSIQQHFRDFLAVLAREGRLDAETSESLKQRGHPYYLHHRTGKVKEERCFLIGDSAGLASIDLGEGIGPAIESARMVASEILGEGTYSRVPITRYSLTGLTQRILQRVLEPRPYR